VTIYTCGSTVYRYAHIGNLRTYLFGDLLRRTLEYLGHEVLYVKNITDVGHMRETGEDPILLAAEVEGKSPEEISEFYADAWLEDEKLLNIRPEDVMPKATDHIPEMLELTADLLEKGLAYEVEVIGHTDTLGDQPYNQQLSMARAGAIRGRLVGDGFATGDIAIAGRGKLDLLVPTGDQVAEPRNRRAEILVR